MSESHKVIGFQGVGKKFCRSLKRSLYYGFLDVTRTFAGVGFDTGMLRKDEFWALSDLSFNVRKGESLGVIGANGSGKSTLLRLILGIYPPDSGRVCVRGKVGSLITLGAGFHPHFTGSENIFFNGTLLGLTKKELKARFNDIVDFAGIGDFIDSPVSTYSSGMRMRLGFAVAIHTDPEVLLIDEILGVGDVGFIRRCYERIEAMTVERGVTAVVVSHNIGMVQKLCRETLVLHKGRAVFLGDTLESISRYFGCTTANSETVPSPGGGGDLIHHPECPRDVSVEEVAIEGRSEVQGFEIRTPEAVTFRIKVANGLEKDLKPPAVNILILDAGMIHLYVNIQSHGLDGGVESFAARSVLTYRCRLPYLNLAPGEYKIIVKLGGPDEGFFHDSALVARPLRVTWSVGALEEMSPIYKDCRLVVPSRWEIL